MLAAAPAALAAPLPVFGRVVDWEGRPVAGAIVEVLSGNLLVTTTRTDGTGFFNVYLEPGTYLIRIYKEGYDVYERSFALSRENAGSIGVVRLGMGLAVIPETSRIEARQGDRVRIPVTLQNRGLVPLSVSLSVAVPSGWTGHVETPSGLVVKNVIVKPLENMSVTLVVDVSRDALGTSRVDLVFKWINFSDSITFTFTVLKRKWRFLETPYREVAAYAGENVKLPLLLSNTLGDEEAFNISYLAPPGWPVLVYDEHGILVNAILLKPGETRNLTLVVHVPVNTSPGVHRVSVTARAGGAASEVTIGFNTKPGYDVLELDLEQKKYSGSAGTNLTIPIVLRNLGTRPTTAVLRASCGVPGVKLFFLDEKGRLVEEEAVEPSQPVRLKLVVRIPPDVKPGSFVVKATARGRYSTAEASATIYVEGRKDFEVLTTNFGVPAVPGTTVTFLLYVKNTGSVNIGSIGVEVGETPKGLKVEAEAPEGPLRPGEEARIKIRVTVAESVAEGVYNIPFKVVGDEIEKPRVLVVNVQSRAGLGYFLFAAAILGIGVAAALYSRREGGRDGGKPGSASDIPAGD